MFIGKLFHGGRVENKHETIAKVEEEFQLTPEFAQKLISRAREEPQEHKPIGFNKAYPDGSKQEEWLNNEANGYTIAFYYPDTSIGAISWSRHGNTKLSIGKRIKWSTKFYKNGIPAEFFTSIISGESNKVFVTTRVERKYARDGWLKSEVVELRPSFGWLCKYRIQKSYYPDGNVRHLFLEEKHRRYHVICYGKLTRHRLRYVMVTGDAPK